MLKIVFVNPIGWDVRRIVNFYSKAVQDFITVEHDLLLYVYPSYTIQSPDGDPSLGLFYIQEPPMIGIAGKNYPNETRGCFLKELPNTIVHEFVHYEQWKTGKEINERGVDSRTCSILRKIKKNAKHNIRTN